jgi:outer membrane lipoprotein LolB
MRVWLAWLVVAVLAGCADLRTIAEQEPVTGPPLENFSAEGRISLRQGDRSDHLQFEWQHSPQRDVVMFSAPLGQGVAELGRDAGGAWLVMPGAPERRAADLSELAQRVFGAPLPLDALADWLRGAQSQLEGEVDGWRIAVTETMPYHQRRLPRRLDLRRGDVELRIVIDAWGQGG